MTVSEQTDEGVMVTAELLGLFFGVIVASMLLALCILIGWYRRPFAAWMAERMRRARLAPYLGGEEAARKSTPGQTLSVSIVGVALTILVGSRAFSLIWAWQNPSARSGVVLAAVGGLVLAIGIFLLVAAGITKRRGRAVAGAAVSLAGACAVIISCALVLA